MVIGKQKGMDLTFLRIMAILEVMDFQNTETKMRRITKRRIEQVVIGLFVFFCGGVFTTLFPYLGIFLSSSLSAFSGAVASQFCVFVTFPQKAIFLQPSSFTWFIVILLFIVSGISINSAIQTIINKQTTSELLKNNVRNDIVFSIISLIGACSIVGWIVFVYYTTGKYEEYCVADVPIVVSSPADSNAFRYRMSQVKTVAEIDGILNEMRQFSFEIHTNIPSENTKNCSE